MLTFLLAPSIVSACDNMSGSDHTALPIMTPCGLFSKRLSLLSSPPAPAAPYNPISELSELSGPNTWPRTCSSVRTPPLRTNMSSGKSLRS